MKRAGALHRWLPLALLLALAPGAALALPDLERGMLALERGDLEAAEHDLLPLARRGYLKAQLSLAGYYAGLDTEESRREAARLYRMALEREPTRRVQLSRVLMRIGDPEALAEAEQRLREADRDGDPEALRALLRLYRDHPSMRPAFEAAALAQRAAGSATLEDRAEAVSWYRAALLADPAYAGPLRDLCWNQRQAQPDCYVDLVRQYRASGDTAIVEKLLGELQQRLKKKEIPPETLERVARSLISQDIPGTPMPQAAYPLLQAANAHSPEAQARMAKLLLEHPDLDREADPMRVLEQAVARGSAEAALELGRIYLEGQRVPADPDRARRWLEQAAATLPPAHFYLGRLYERGYEGRADTERALDHYLRAARAGYARADLAIAQMYWKNRGVRPNGIAAYSFAQLARHAEVAGSEELLAELNTALTRQQKVEAVRVAEAEFTARRHAELQALPASPEEKLP